MVVSSKLKTNYHTHASYCGHAFGKVSDYVEKAISLGYEVLGFSDHTPYPFPNGFYDTIRMRPEMQKQYVDEILECKEKYKNDIEIYIGYEVEYYPKHFKDLLDMLNRYPCDYIILGQHCLNNEYDGAEPGSAPEDPKILEQYVNQTCEAMKLGVFTYFAHPDLVKFVGPNDVYEEHMDKLLKTAIETDTPLEINLRGIWNYSHYPSERFFKLAAKYGCKVIIGIDAHTPEALAFGTDLDKAYRIVNKYSLNLIERAELKTPRLLTTK